MAKKKSDFLPRDQVVRNLIDFWRDKPDAEDILAMLIEEPTRWQPQPKRKKNKQQPCLFTRILHIILYI